MRAFLTLIGYLFYSIAGGYVRHVSRKRGYRLAHLLARIKYFIAPQIKRALYSNLRMVWGKKLSDKEIKGMIWNIFPAFASYVTDFFRSPTWNEEDVDRFVEVENKDYLDQALSYGKGVVALSLHFGNWELGAVAVALKGYPLNIIVLGHGKRRVTDIFRKMREAKGIRVIPLGIGIRKCFQVLRNNEMLAMMGDWDIGKGGIKVEFFGQKALVPKGPAFFSLKTGAVVVPIFMLRKNEKYHLIFEKPILPSSTGNEEKDILCLTKEYLKILERYIKEYPGEWFLFHPMWPSS